MQTANEADKVLLGKQPHQALNNLSYGNYHAENFRKKIAVWKTLSTIVLPKPYRH